MGCNRGLTKEILRSLVSYNPDTGIFTWRPREGKDGWNKRWAGNRAFTSTESNGYFQGTVGGVCERVHRLVWLYEHGYLPNKIDHINGNRQDNRLKNLRASTDQENNRNVGVPKDNKTGVMGVRVEKRTGKWTANIRVNRKYMHLGTFGSFFDAVCARKRAELDYGFYKNHGTHESWRHGRDIIGLEN